MIMPQEFAIVIDATVDFDPHLDTSQFAIVPVYVIMNGTSYLSDQLPEEEYAAELEKGKITTSQPSPAQFIEAYQELTDKHPAILSIHISSKLSGTLNSARIASEEFDNVYLFDTETASIAAGYLFRIAYDAMQRGLAIEQTLKLLEMAKEQAVFRIFVSNIDYLHRSGRINFMMRGLLKLLDIIPILTTEDGKITTSSLKFGRKSAISYLNTEIKKHADQDILYLAHTKYKDYFDAFDPFADRNPIKIQIGKPLETHTGPGAIGFLTGPSFDQLLNESNND